MFIKKNNSHEILVNNAATLTLHHCSFVV